MIKTWWFTILFSLIVATASEAASSEARHHSPFLAKRITGLLAVRQGAVSCGGGKFCNPGQFCIPGGCCVNGEIQCMDDTGGCCRAGTYCDADGCCPNGQTCTGGGGGVITLPNPSSDDDDGGFTPPADSETDSGTSFTTSDDSFSATSTGLGSKSTQPTGGLSGTQPTSLGSTSTGKLGGTSAAGTGTPLPTSQSGGSPGASASQGGSGVIVGSANDAAQLFSGSYFLITLSILSALAIRLH